MDPLKQEIPFQKDHQSSDSSCSSFQSFFLNLLKSDNFKNSQTYWLVVYLTIHISQLFFPSSTIIFVVNMEKKDFHRPPKVRNFLCRMYGLDGDVMKTAFSLRVWTHSFSELLYPPPFADAFVYDISNWWEGRFFHEHFGDFFTSILVVFLANLVGLDGLLLVRIRFILSQGEPGKNIFGTKPQRKHEKMW